MCVEIPSIEDDPYIYRTTYRYIHDIQKSYKVTILLDNRRPGIYEGNFEIFEEYIKKDFLANVGIEGPNRDISDPFNSDPFLFSTTTEAHHMDDSTQVYSGAPLPYQGKENGNYF